MARVIYTLPLPGGEIDGIRFTEDRGQLVSDEISDEAAARLATLHGFQAIAVPAKPPTSATTPVLDADGGPLTEQPLGSSADVPTETRLTAAQKAAATRARKQAEQAAAGQQQSGETGQEGGEGANQGQQEGGGADDKGPGQAEQQGGTEGEADQKAEGTEGA